MKVKKQLGIVVALAGLFASGAAFSQTMSYTLAGGGATRSSSEVIDVFTPVADAQDKTQAGRWTLSFGAATLQAYSYGFVLPSAGTYTLNATPVDSRISSLYNNYYADSLINSSNAATFQLAVWRASCGNYCSVDDFSPNDSQEGRDVWAQAGVWLNSTASSSAAYTVLRYSQNDGGAFLVAQAVPAVPEPESYAMLLAGLGLMGVIARRRSRRR